MRSADKFILDREFAFELGDFADLRDRKSRGERRATLIQAAEVPWHLIK